MRFVSNATLSALMTLFFMVGVCNGQSADEHYDKGAEYGTQGKLKEAGDEFEKALQVDPLDLSSTTGLQIVKDATSGKIKEETAVHIFNSLALANKGMWNEAIAEADKAVALSSDYTQAYSSRGNIYALQGQYDKAIADYSKAIELDPGDAEAYYNRGVMHAQKRDYDQAIENYNKALEVDPKYFVSYFARGSAHANKGDYDQGFSDYDKALEINTKYAEVYLNRGLLYYLVKRDYDKAIADFSKAVEINPKDVDAYYNRGVV